MTPRRAAPPTYAYCQDCGERLAGRQPSARHDHREERDHLEGTVRRRTEALLHGLVGALQCRDAETQWHSRRVSRYARHLALRLGVVGPELDTLELGALLHDIGKLGIRDGVLLKPGPLSVAERAEMRRHPELGWELLQKIDVLQPASRVVLEHQEMWNGNGYPRGLRGEQVSIGARVFNVVDTMDAMTSERPYRKAAAMEVVRRELVGCAGSQFDPRVVDAFLGIPDLEWDGLRREVESGADPLPRGLASLVG